MLPQRDPVGASLREFPVKITSVLISIYKMGPGSIDSVINCPYILKFWLNVTIHSAGAHYIFNYCGISLLAVQMSFTKKHLSCALKQIFSS